MPFIVAAVLSVTLASPFGPAEATATAAVEGGLTVEVTVALDVSATVVVVRGRHLVDELAPVALSELEPGLWGGIIELERAVDLSIGFEAYFPDGKSSSSEINRLSELGVDRALFVETPGSSSTTVDELHDRGATEWIWLAIGAAAAALALLAVWVLLDRGGGERTDRDDGLGELEAPVNGPQV